MTDHDVPDDVPDRSGDDPARDALEAFNAEEILDRPGEPPRDGDSPADESDVPAPG
jgi:hypothetical protein